MTLENFGQLRLTKTSMILLKIIFNFLLKDWFSSKIDQVKQNSQSVHIANKMYIVHCVVYAVCMVSRNTSGFHVYLIIGFHKYLYLYNDGFLRKEIYTYGKKVLPDGPNCLSYFAGTSKSHCGISIFCIVLNPNINTYYVSHSTVTSPVKMEYG